jgi:cyanate permease
MLLAVNLRLGLSSFSALLSEVQRDLSIGPASVGFLVALPVLCMGVFSFVTGSLVRRFGDRRVAAVSVAIIGLATVLRVGGYHLSILVTSTVLLGAGIAVTQALLPGIVRTAFGGNVVRATSLYTAALGLGATVAAALSSPFANEFGWPIALAVWSPIGLVAALVWWRLAAVAPAPVDERLSSETSQPALRRGTVWIVAAGIGGASLIYYVMLSWLPDIYIAYGTSSRDAALGLSVFTLVQVPMPLVVSVVSARTASMTALIRGALLPTILGVSGLLVFGGDLWWLTSMLLGAGSGLLFPLMLTLPALHTSGSDSTARVSGSGFGIGYLLAAPAPFLFGLGRSLSHGSDAPLCGLLVFTLLLLVIAPNLLPRCPHHEETHAGPL